MDMSRWENRFSELFHLHEYHHDIDAAATVITLIIITPLLMIYFIMHAWAKSMYAVRAGAAKSQNRQGVSAIARLWWAIYATPPALFFLPSLLSRR